MQEDKKEKPDAENTLSRELFVSSNNTSLSERMMEMDETEDNEDDEPERA